MNACDICNDKGIVTCPTCDGMAVVKEAKDKYVTCLMCRDHSGMINCDCTKQHVNSWKLIYNGTTAHNVRS